MIEITQHYGKWRIEIEEEWQFETKKEFDEALRQINSLKGKHGNIWQIEQQEEKDRELQLKNYKETNV